MQGDHQNDPDLDELKRWWSSPERQKRQSQFLGILSVLWQERPKIGEGPVRGIIAQGELDGRPYDVSSLAAALHQPRTTTFRLVEYLCQEGVVVKRRKGRRTELFLTRSGWVQMKELWNKVDPLIDQFVLEQARSIRKE